jgi:hypothetical protein
MKQARTRKIFQLKTKAKAFSNIFSLTFYGFIIRGSGCLKPERPEYIKFLP